MDAHEQQVERVIEAGIAFGATATTVTDVAAQVLGLNRTDMRVVTLLRRHGSLAAGRIAALAGISPAAASTVVRRLVEAEYVDRAVDPSDGRRGVVTLTDHARARLAEMYGPMLEQGRDRLRTLDADQLAIVEEFLRYAERLQAELAARLGRLGSGGG